MPRQDPRDSSRSRSPRSNNEDAPPREVRRKGWGSVARKGAATINDEGSGRSSDNESAPPVREDETWVREGVTPPPRRRRRRDTAEIAPLSEETVKELEARAGRQAARMQRYMGQAVAAYTAGRFADANRSLKPVLDVVGEAPSVRELNGMILYRSGKWAKALEELTAAHLATHTFDLYPAMMDCNRALKRFGAVHELWAELREASPSAEVVLEGRIVEAGALADQDNLQAAIILMEKSPKVRNKPKEHHLRGWYALASLYERASDFSRARQTFELVAEHDPELADVQERIEALA